MFCVRRDVYVHVLFVSPVIEGDAVSAVAHAKRRVEMVAWTNRFKEEATHFISIPLNSAIVMEKFNQFKAEVLASCGKVGIFKSCYGKVNKVGSVVVQGNV